MNKKKQFVLFIAVVFGAVSLHSETAIEPSTNVVFEVTSPKRGAKVGAGVKVKGKAQLPPGHHLWVFARRVDFEPFWWPQNEARVSPVSGKWEVYATIGEPHDSGWEFDLAVAVFKEDAHRQLQEYRRHAMRTGDWKPIEMPEAAAPPEFLSVKKKRVD